MTAELTINNLSYYVSKWGLFPLEPVQPLNLCGDFEFWVHGSWYEPFYMNFDVFMRKL